MSNTDIAISPINLMECFDRVRKGLRFRTILGYISVEMARNQRDMNKTGDMDSYEYYAGFQDALLMVSNWIAPVKETKRADWNYLLGLQDRDESKSEAA